MESYIVRIYRSEKDNPAGLVGIVEQVGRSDRLAFTNLEEMWEILNPKASKPRPDGKKKECREKQKAGPRA